jgi:hypothetical protein
VVCKDLVTIPDPIYLWRFFDQVRKESHLIELPNESTANPRFDLFTLILPTDINLKQATYYYEIYQSDTEGATNYEDMPILAEGLARINIEFDENTTYESTGSSDTVYTG